MARVAPTHTAPLHAPLHPFFTPSRAPPPPLRHIDFGLTCGGEFRKPDLSAPLLWTGAAHGAQTCAAVVTCGGLCPGTNTVVRELVNTLWFRYGVRNILGVRNGYRGFYGDDYDVLTPDKVPANN
eukprot:4571040-Pyramimonas_sp.AAC.1